MKDGVSMSIDLERLQVSAPVRLYREFVTFHPLQIDPLQGEQWRPRQRVPDDARRRTHACSTRCIEEPATGRTAVAVEVFVNNAG